VSFIGSPVFVNMGVSDWSYLFSRKTSVFCNSKTFIPISILFAGEVMDRY